MRQTLAQEFPVRATLDINAEAMDSDELWSPERFRAEHALQFLYREEYGEIQLCPPREDVEIRREIRKLRVRLRGLRKRDANSHSSAE